MRRVEALKVFYKRPQAEINEIVTTNPFGFKGYIRRRKDIYPKLGTAKDFENLTWEDHYGRWNND